MPNHAPIKENSVAIAHTGLFSISQEPSVFILYRSIILPFCDHKKLLREGFHNLYFQKRVGIIGI